MIRESTSEVVQSPPVPAGDKGKKVVEDVPPPKKKQRTIPSAEPRQTTPVDGTKRLFVDLNLRLDLDDAAEPLGVSTASAALSRMTHTANTMGSGMWNKLGDDDEMNLLDPGIHSSLMVRIPLFSICA